MTSDDVSEIILGDSRPHKSDSKAIIKPIMQVMGSFGSNTNSSSAPFDENSYLSLADASILAQYYGDK